MLTVLGVGAAEKVMEGILPKTVSAETPPFLRPPAGKKENPKASEKKLGFEAKNGIYYRDDIIWRGPADQPRIAITVDDGYNYRGIQTAADFVEKYKIPLSFFIYGQNFEGKKCKEQIVRAWKLGCELQNHTQTHPNLVKLAEESDAKVQEEIKKAQDAILSVTGGKDNSGKYLRPPGGDYNHAVVRIAHKLGLEVINWWTSSGGTGEGATEETILGKLRKTVKGDIVLLHFQGEDVSLLEKYWLEILNPAGLTPVLLSDLVPSRF